MFLTNHEKPDDPNYAYLKMLSLAYKPEVLGAPETSIFGVVIEFFAGPFSSERKLLVSYSSGFCSFYTTQNGGNINGSTLKYTEKAELSPCENFIATVNEKFPDHSISEKSGKLIDSAAEYLIHTIAGIHPEGSQEVQIWFLTHSGIVSGSAHFFEIMDKQSVWTKFFNDAFSISKDLESYGPDRGRLPKAVSF